MDASLKRIYSDLMSVTRKIIDVDMELSMIEHFINRLDTRAVELWKRSFYNDEEFNAIDENLDAAFQENKHIIRRMSGHNESNVGQISSLNKFVPKQNLIDDAAVIIQRIRSGYRCHDVSYTTRFDILKNIGMFYSLVDILHFFCSMKRIWMSCKGIEEHLYDACCNEEIEKLLTAVLVKYESQLETLEANLIDNHFSDSSCLILKSWIDTFGECCSSKIINDELRFGELRKKDFDEYIDINRQILGYHDDLEKLWESHELLKREKETLLREKENKQNDLSKQEYEQKLRFRQKNAYIENQRLDSYREKRNYIINIKNKYLDKKVRLPSVSLYTYRPSYKSESEWNGRGNYLDSRDWAETK